MENLSSNGKLRDKAVTRRSDLKGDSSKHRESSSSKLTKRWQPVLYKTGRFVLTQFIEQSLNTHGERQILNLNLTLEKV